MIGYFSMAVQDSARNTPWSAFANFNGLSEQLSPFLHQQGVRTVFKSENTQWSDVVRPKDATNLTQDTFTSSSLGVVFWEVYARQK